MQMGDADMLFKKILLSSLFFSILAVPIQAQHFLTSIYSCTPVVFGFSVGFGVPYLVKELLEKKRKSVRLLRRNCDLLNLNEQKNQALERQNRIINDQKVLIENLRNSLWTTPNAATGCNNEEQAVRRNSLSDLCVTNESSGSQLPSVNQNNVVATQNEPTNNQIKVVDQKKVNTLAIVEEVLPEMTSSISFNKDLPKGVPLLCESLDCFNNFASILSANGGLSIERAKNLIVNGGAFADQLFNDINYIPKITHPTSDLITIIKLMWYFYSLAIYKEQDFIESGTFLVKDKWGRLSQFLKIYAERVNARKMNDQSYELVIPDWLLKEGLRFPVNNEHMNFETRANGFVALVVHHQSRGLIEAIKKPIEWARNKFVTGRQIAQLRSEDLPEADKQNLNALDAKLSQENIPGLYPLNKISNLVQFAEMFDTAEILANQKKDVIDKCTEFDIRYDYIQCRSGNEIILTEDELDFSYYYHLSKANKEAAGLLRGFLEQFIELKNRYKKLKELLNGSDNARNKDKIDAESEFTKQCNATKKLGAIAMPLIKRIRFNNYLASCLDSCERCKNEKHLLTARHGIFDSYYYFLLHKQSERSMLFKGISETVPTLIDRLNRGYSTLEQMLKEKNGLAHRNHGIEKRAYEAMTSIINDLDYHILKSLKTREIDIYSQLNGGLEHSKARIVTLVIQNGLREHSLNEQTIEAFENICTNMLNEWKEFVKSIVSIKKLGLCSHNVQDTIDASCAAKNNIKFVPNDVYAEKCKRLDEYFETSKSRYQENFQGYAKELLSRWENFKCEQFNKSFFEHCKERLTFLNQCYNPSQILSEDMLIEDIIFPLLPKGGPVNMTAEAVKNWFSNPNRSPLAQEINKLYNALLQDAICQAKTKIDDFKRGVNFYASALECELITEYQRNQLVLEIERVLACTDFSSTFTTSERNYPLGQPEKFKDHLYPVRLMEILNDLLRSYLSDSNNFKS